ncbi:nitroreductase/quinone reductase family protein [Streptomyces sp. NPDC127049]|uniref:nitroreductase/quinone reductase family protein n=1 Tax=Streptomyces sp. NPDC127049 TaxID=3347118 RepID=UPI0036480220
MSRIRAPGGTRPAPKALDSVKGLRVVGSAGGSDRHPDWYRNILRNPTVTVELGADTWQATAVAATGAERDALFAKAVAAAPGYADYQRATSRVLSVVVLHRIPASDHTPPSRLDALAAELVKIHDRLRGELAVLFPYLAREFPGKAEVFERLRSEHDTVARVLEDLRGMLARVEDTGPGELRPAFERLRSELETHFAYEEAELVPLLEGVG